jgi:hypothetical protein
LYFRVLKPHGILLLHLSNRNLALEAPAAADARATGATALMQEYSPPKSVPQISSAPTQAMVLSRAPASLAVLAKDPRWRMARDRGVRPWTDDYTNIVGPLIEQARRSL